MVEFSVIARCQGDGPVGITIMDFAEQVRRAFASSISTPREPGPAQQAPGSNHGD
jgi:hypothetical protein